MPELPEVETVRKMLYDNLKNNTIQDINIIYPKIIEYPSVEEFSLKIKNQKINNILRKGKWLIFELDNNYLLSHLRMEGKYSIYEGDYNLNKHQHVVFKLKDKDLVYQDTRKFGRMHLIEKDELNTYHKLIELGKEPWDKDLDIEYLKDKYKNKNIPIKTTLLDQNIITGIGNIYADEILFLSNINPLTKPKDLKDKDLELIIDNTKKVLEKAIKLGGTTIRTFSVDNIHGKFQNELYVHGRKDESCLICKSAILKIKVNGRGTYYCPKCQK